MLQVKQNLGAMINGSAFCQTSFCLQITTSIILKSFLMSSCCQNISSIKMKMGSSIAEWSAHLLLNPKVLGSHLESCQSTFSCNDSMNLLCLIWWLQLACITKWYMIYYSKPYYKIDETDWNLCCFIHMNIYPTQSHN